ncbi:elongation factor EF-2, partial [Candidatus Micrarchaeota archaeon]|nr:elongation factor EF-2 [Candidatus Micrarchaeota archaeon]
DKESRYGKAMISCDPKGPVTFMITAIQVDPHAGDVAVGRIYSGTLKKGVDLYLATQYKTEKLQGVAVYMGPDRVLVEEAPAGNIVALVGLKEMYAGETVSEGKMESFEKIKHHSEPVVTKSIEAKNPRDLVKLIEVLRKIGKEDPTLKVVINQETGEQLISGMGELHLEIIEYKIRNERGVEIETSPPIVVYEETIQKKGPEYLQDIKELLLDAFDQAMSQGPLAKEKCVGVKVKLTDASIHVDPAHRGPAQIIPAVRRPIYASMLQADCVLLEPKQKLFVNVPSEYMSSVINLVQGRRGQIADIQQEGESVNINSKVPVSQMFGFATDVRGASQGRAVWYYEYAGYEKLPTNLQAPTITSIRKRKGEPETPPTAKDFMD